MPDTTFAALATVRARTKRASLTGGHQLYLYDLKCWPLAPVDAETRKRLDLQTPHTVFETFIEGSYDIRKGDELVIDDVVYPIRSVAPWPMFTVTRMHLIIEDLRS